MKAVILVGGLGTRMLPLTNHLPKPMLPIANVPFIERMVRWLARHEVDEVILSMGYLPDAIAQHFEANPVAGVSVRYVVEDHPLGTGGGIRHAARDLGCTFLALNGDVLTDFDVTAAVTLHREHKACVTMALAAVKDPAQYGVVETDRNGHLLRFTEKPPPHEVRSNLINAGVYVMEPEALTEVPDGRACSIEREIFPALLAQWATFLSFHLGDSYWLDLGTPAKYLTANFDVLAGRLKAEVNGLRCDGALFGLNVKVSTSARIGARVVLGDNVTVEDNAMVNDSVLWSDTTVGHGARVQGAVIGRGCVVMPNVIVVPGAVFKDGTTIG